MKFKKVNTPLKGDLIRVRRKAGYYHYGIATSSNTVIHYSDYGNDSVLDVSKVRIIETTLDEFLRGDELQVNLPFDSPFDRDVIVNKARDFLGVYKFRDKQYNLVTNNCEHFARFIYYGDSKSKQVVTVSSVLIALGISLVSTALVVNKLKKHK